MREVTVAGGAARAGREGERGGGQAPLHGIAALQRAAGNAAVTRWIQRAAEPPQAGREREYAMAPTAHGEWRGFCTMMREAGVADDVVDDAWQLVLGGLADQGTLNTEAESIQDVQERRDRAMANTWFSDLVKLVGNHLEINTPTLALWSGGEAVSRYAAARGHTPLEETRFGRVLDRLVITPDWDLKLPMWRVVSQAFVSRATGPVHIFLRAYEPESVLLLQEVPQLRAIQAMNPNVTLHWHPLYTLPDGTLREVASDLQLVDDASYTSRDRCTAALYQYLLRVHDRGNAQGEHAYRAMSAGLAANGNPQD
ncbi:MULTISPECIES: hypothetical protein [Streptomyces]|uniref:hypothetical protein n=1 Tax=Streptomyces TaxID=1883 RepID=UPI001679386E|nr:MULTISPECIES: hypothetical protein [Streptomyces]MBD3575397.1 hypothetical protein [Streptomyces sp. KD18]GGS92928.1 hypothetical protein GCM10010286_17170 [Streptomyces toxytricini]